MLKLCGKLVLKNVAELFIKIEVVFWFDRNKLGRLITDIPVAIDYCKLSIFLDDYRNSWKQLLIEAAFCE